MVSLWVLALLIFWGIILLFNNLRRCFKVQWYSLLCQTGSSLFSHPKSSSIDHSLAMSYLVSLALTTSLSTSSNLMGSWGGISVVVWRFYLASRLSYCPTIIIFLVSPQDSSLMRSSMVTNWVDFLLFGISQDFLGLRDQWHRR